MTLSMTGYAGAQGAEGGQSWAWELRSVNGRTLELRLRLPPGLEGLEASLREAAGKELRRGNVTANLSVRHEEKAPLTADPATLDAVLGLIAQVAARVPQAPPPRIEAILALPGVLRAGPAPAEAAATERLAAEVFTGFQQALRGLVGARRDEGGRLGTVVSGLLDEIEALRQAAVTEAADQPARLRARLTETLAALMGSAPMPEERVAQEIALAAGRADVREELDRLDSHVRGARAMLAEDVAIGRRLEFLVQEFNREANTLCSKSASVALTAIGLRLKAAIEQLREQVANIE